MARDRLAKLGAPITRPPGDLPHLGGTMHPEGGGGAMTSTREVRHRGHTVRITTTYTITVDGEPLHAHVDVDDLGRVHYHGLPNYNFASAVDMVRELIDTDPASFPPPRTGSGGHGDGHGGGHG